MLFDLVYVVPSVVMSARFFAFDFSTNNLRQIQRRAYAPQLVVTQRRFTPWRKLHWLRLRFCSVLMLLTLATFNQVSLNTRHKPWRVSIQILTRACREYLFTNWFIIWIKKLVSLSNFYCSISRLRSLIWYNVNTDADKTITKANGNPALSYGFNSCFTLARQAQANSLTNPDSYRLFAEMCFLPDATWMAAITV